MDPPHNSLSLEKIEVAPNRLYGDTETFGSVKRIDLSNLFG
jgi:hypothetical protein